MSDLLSSCLPRAAFGVAEHVCQVLETETHHGEEIQWSIEEPDA